MNSNLFRLAGWSAYLSAIATLAAFATLIIFFAVGDPFGIINDAITVIGSTILIPVLLALYQLHHVHTPAASLGALMVGIIAVLFAGTLQALLVFKVITYAQTALPVPLAYGMFGLSLAYSNYLAYVHSVVLTCVRIAKNWRVLRYTTVSVVPPRVLRSGCCLSSSGTNPCSEISFEPT